MRPTDEGRLKIFAENPTTMEPLAPTTNVGSKLPQMMKEQPPTMIQPLQCPSETELARLCRAGIWMGVFARAQTHPHEAYENEVTARGEGTTVLAMAVRLGAPLLIIQQLLNASIQQITVTHMVRGTVLHEAFKHRACDDILECLVQATIAYSRQHSRAANLLAQKDELGRTCLHYIVDRVVRSLDRRQKNDRTIWDLFRKIVQAHPASVQTLDADGNTPLILLLLIPKGFNANGEKEIENGLKMMLELCPTAVQVSRRLPRPWHYQFQPESQSSILHGDGVPSPLSCALLHGRSIEAVDLLLDAGNRVGINACRAIITQNREIPLHIATSMRCPVEVLSRLHLEDHAVTSTSDIHGLNGLDWTWIRHVIDWCSMSDPFAPVVVSRRRYLNHNFIEWYNKVSNQYLGNDTPLVSEIAQKLRHDIVNRMSILLPSLAKMLLLDEMEEDNDSLLSLVHAASFVNCPLAMVQLACESFPRHLQQKDKRMMRLPLHYAVSRGGYAIHYPIGVSCNLRYVEEISPIKAVLSRFPGACRITDKRWQLPLHIAIDFWKSGSKVADFPDKLHERSSRDCHEGVELLLGQYPEALQRRDGNTKLYPFLQAAEGRDAHVELTFLLLRRDPSLLAEHDYQ